MTVSFPKDSHSYPSSPQQPMGYRSNEVTPPHLAFPSCSLAVWSFNSHPLSPSSRIDTPSSCMVCSVYMCVTLCMCVCVCVCESACVLHNGNERKQIQESVFFGVVRNVIGSRLCEKLRSAFRERGQVQAYRCFAKLIFFQKRNFVSPVDLRLSTFRNE